MGRFRARTPLPPGFGTIWLAVAIDLIGFGIVLPILPIYARRFHTTAFQATLLVAAFSAASLVCSPIWGRISDRFGRRPVLLVSLAGTAVGSLLTGLAGGLAVLLIGRIIDGASGASVSVAQAAASDLATPAARPRLFGLLGAAFGVGFVAGPALGALAALWGPRLPFFLAAGLATINTLVALRRLPETRSPGLRPRPRRPGSLAALAGGRGVVPLLGVAFCALAAFGGFEATFALFGQTHLGLGIASAAAVFSIVGLVLVVVQAGLVQPVVARFGEKRTLVGGLLANAAGLVVLADARSWALRRAGAPSADGRPGAGPDHDGDARGDAVGPGRPGPGSRSSAVRRRPGSGGGAGSGRSPPRRGCLGNPLSVRGGADAGGGGPGPRPRPLVARPARRPKRCYSGVTNASPRRLAMTDFSMALNEDQLTLQKWVHDFAENVVRPAAHEWDEREETPWPIIEEAARIGLYSFDFVASMFADPTGLSVPVVMEEMAWGDAGIGLAIFGTTLGVAGIFGTGTREQIAEWLPQCFGTPDKIALAAFCVSEPDAGSDVSSMRTRATYDEATDEWVLNGTKTWITNGGIADIHVVVATVDPDLKGARPGQLRRAPRDEGSVTGPEVQEDGHPGLAHRRGGPR